MAQSSRALVVEKVRQVFPDRDPDEILAVLDDYGREGSEAETARVQLAILKLFDEAGRDDPNSYVAAAKADYRNVLAWAEYPNQFRETGDLDAEARETLKRLDAAQYQEWLARKGLGPLDDSLRRRGWCRPPEAMGGPRW